MDSRGHGDLATLVDCRNLAWTEAIIFTSMIEGQGWSSDHPTNYSSHDTTNLSGVRRVAMMSTQPHNSIDKMRARHIIVRDSNGGHQSASRI
jgi:hypothetical protein